MRAVKLQPGNFSSRLMLSAPAAIFYAALFSIMAAAMAANAADMTGPQYRSFDVQAMGGSGTASIGGPSSMYLNPAGLGGLQGFGVEASTDAGYNPQLLQYKDWADANSKYFSNVDSLLAHMDPAIEFPKWASVTNSIVLQGHYDGLAVSVVRDVRYDVTFDNVPLTPALGAGMQSDLQLLVGQGFALGPDWNLGIAVKAIYRQSVEDTLYGIISPEYTVIQNTWQRSSSSIWNSLDKITVASQLNPKNQFGAGLNLGVKHSMGAGFSVGASFLDFPTYFDGKLLAPQFNSGLSYAADVGDSVAFDCRLLMNLDWQYPFIAQPWYTEWKTGASLEGRFGGRRIALASIGLNDGYPTYGAEIGYILYAYYLYTAEEAGTYPGQSRQTFQKFGIDLNF